MRRFAAFTGGWPWQWTPAQVETWVAAGGWAHSTVRSYQGALVLFLEYVCDPRYGWVAECEQRAGAAPGADLPRVEHRAHCTTTRAARRRGR